MAKSASGGKSSGGGAKKETSQSVSAVASKGLRTGKLTPAETRKVSASALGQDETKGKKK
ncbi:hypothetical protein GTW51_08870 [Aurantimonas aggregata]|uniref:Uncharacterized protein n=1 Tax=Aurantimonas aggregata TaxID=2047720 RepID=A0A6L9MG42_9HYPH|nr:hypothetical protein [Aurantimonas aggregata]NDV86814.1 hypothetical protein [Aurantimonas aggregata]